MSNHNPTRAELVAALRHSEFVGAASKVTGSLLRNIVAQQFEAAGLDVVVVAANGVGAKVPFPGAEIVWQKRSGGEFKRNLISWDTGETTAVTQSPSGAVRLVANCMQCGQRNELTIDTGVPAAGLPCSRCGSPLIALGDSGS